MLPYSRQLICQDDVEVVGKTLSSELITQGPKVKEFEEALSRYCSAKYAVAFSSGTAALHAAYFVAGLKPGDEVITSPITFVATANAALFLGAKPIFVDVEEDTGNINPKLLEPAITPQTKVIVPVDFAGHPCDFDEIIKVAKKHKLTVIEDACHALGAEYKGRKIGSISDMTVLSFHPVKPITTGEGGAVLTNNDKFYEKLLMFRHHGITRNSTKFVKEPDGDWYYEMQFLGLNYRITDFQCALGTSQLKKIDEFIKRRREIAKIYREKLDDLEHPPERTYARSSWHLYHIKLKDTSKKREIFKELRERGIGVQVHYIPVYWHPYYEKLGYKRGLCTTAENFYRRELSIPIFQMMSDDDVNFVIKNVKEVLK